MYYGQQNYYQKIGTSNYTIRQVGCFLTAFSNLIKQRRGKNFPPDQLNQAFIKAHAYIGTCDLYWDSIRKINPSWKVTAIGKGIPPTRRSIVCMQASNSFGTHFSKVYSIVGSTVYIIDSWDGKIKNAAAYGPIISWAAYNYV